MVFLTSIFILFCFNSRLFKFGVMEMVVFIIGKESGGVVFLDRYENFEEKYFYRWKDYKNIKLRWDVLLVVMVSGCRVIFGWGRVGK